MLSPSGYWTDWCNLINTSVGASTLVGYTACFERFLTWLQDRRSYPAVPWYREEWMFVYITHLFKNNKKLQSVAEFSAAFSFHRIKHGYGRVSKQTRASVLTQVFLAFKKLHKLANVCLPDSLKMRRFLHGALSFSELMMFWCYWSCAVLGLRSKEIFRLDKAFIHFQNGKYLIKWPTDWIGNGIKAGPVRILQDYHIPILTMFLSCKHNPFLPWEKADQMNRFLQARFGVTMRSARHLGAYICLHEMNGTEYVAKCLGHSTLVATCYYLDPWAPSVHHSVLTAELQRLIQQRIGGPGKGPLPVPTGL